MEIHERFFTWQMVVLVVVIVQLDYPLTAFVCLFEFMFCLFQEVHDLLQDYELKYCYVDRNKRTGKISILSTWFHFDSKCVHY